jgi:hypothetical protein
MVKSVFSNSSAGRSPLKKLILRSSNVRLAKFTSSVGIGPDRKFLPTLNVLNSVISPNVVGRTPERLFPPRLRYSVREARQKRPLECQYYYSYIDAWITRKKESLISRKQALLTKGCQQTNLLG